ncbi:GerAB/ArcD/ProY family transporter [Alicyclobacillus mengziensis]|uniref:GerAB/ArcD/ProY family transporter n=1 Tax=Alicyclobacillus mengziensis TaxID=2931921 RepID=A0A9X7VVH6_9BACL|nr:GerAB/ArcD/ProY family transporter [Alicyclobacillus mengziensis]QSO45836.1 GerAB/ArcD/ProY family transporter [Alicyclobacillus mengziensis]
MTQISRLQFLYLMLWLVLGTGITVLPFSIAQFTILDGWLVPLFFFFGSTVAAAIGAMFIRTFPNQSLMQAFETAFGSWLGRAVGLWVLTWCFIHTGMLLRELSLFVSITSVPLTPQYIIAGVITIPIAYAVFHGLEVVGRLAEFLTPIALTLAFVLAILALQNMDLSQLRPVLADGFTPVFRAALLPSTSFCFQFLIGLQFVTSLHNGKTFGRDLLLIGVVLSLAGLMIEGIIISVLGPSATYLSLPVGEVVRGIRIGQFVERLDTIYVMGAMATMVVKIQVFLYVTASIMKELFRLPNAKHVVWPASVAAWTGSILYFHNASDLHDFMVYTSPAYYSFTLALLPLIATLVHRTLRLMGLRRL